IFVDDDGNPLVHMGNVDSESEVMWEQWRETKRDDDYGPCDDDLYESHDMPDHLQAIYDDDMYENHDMFHQAVCDDLDIMVHGRKKKYIIFVESIVI
ncbi:hypothetical protein Tco_0342094, partial [Tanacetum coccineum]